MRNIGLIILGVSIIISSVILSKSYRMSEDWIGQNISLNASHGFNGNNNPIKLHFDSSPASNEFTVGDTSRLYVITKHSANKRYFKGTGLTAMYFREGHLLRVVYNVESRKIVKYIVNPLEWGTDE